MNGIAPPARFERTLARIMLGGVWASSALLAVGLVLVLTGRATQGETLLRIGLLCLMVTPMLRVALSIVESLRLRDYFWLWSTIAVVLVLAGTIAYSFNAARPS